MGAAEPVTCAKVEHAGARYDVCTVDLTAGDVRLFWAGPDGKPLNTFATLAAEVARRGQRLLFATNAGMFDKAYKPVGLYVENGRRVVSANTRSGPGNFHMKPNGVLFWGRSGAGVMETGRFLKTKPDAQFASQSGPMLVTDGAIHPQFQKGAPSHKIRNGVGSRDGHTLVFALSAEPVRFHAFAALFQDRLGCRNALFLDGSLSEFYGPATGDTDSFGAFGPMVGVVAR